MFSPTRTTATASATAGAAVAASAAATAAAAAESPEVRYEQFKTQWMREALESRQVMEELKAHNDKLQHEVDALNARLALVFDCCTDLKVMERLGEIMQKKLRDQHLQQMPSDNRSPRGSRTKQQQQQVANNNHSNNRVDPTTTPTTTFICGSTSFQQSIVHQSSYQGQQQRQHFHHRNVFDAEEFLFRDCDIFGQQKFNARSTSHPPVAATGEPLSPPRRHSEEHLGGGTGAIVLPTPVRAGSRYWSPGSPTRPSEMTGPVSEPNGGNASKGDTIDHFLAQQATCCCSYGASPNKSSYGLSATSTSAAGGGGGASATGGAASPSGYTGNNSRSPLPTSSSSFH